MKTIACYISSLVILVCSPNSPAAPLPAPRTQERPAIAASSNSYFVVWSDSRVLPKQIYGARVSFGGEVLDPGGIPICTRPGYQDAPSVAFDGENYLVVWLQSDSESAVFGARVTPSGRVLDRDGFRITSTNSSPTWPVVASNGRNFFVTWPDWLRTPDSIADVYGTPVAKDGTVANPDGIKIFGGRFWQMPEKIVSANGEYLIVFFNDPDSDALFWGTRVSESGVLLTPAGFPISSSTALDWVGVATDGANYFVAWVDYRFKNFSSGTGALSLFGTLVSADGHMISPGGTQLGPQGPPIYGDPPDIGWDGKEYLMTWAEAPDGSIPDIYAGVINSDGHAGSPWRFPVSAGPGFQAYPRLQFGGSDYMAVWVDVRARPEDYYPTEKADIYGAVVSSTGAVTPADGILVSSAPSPVAVLPSQIVISGNNLNASVHLDGSASFDPNGFPLTYLWFIDGSSTTLGTNSSLDLSLPVGTHSVVLEVSNGYSSSDAQASVKVITAGEATLALLRKIEQAGLRANLRAPLEAQLVGASRHFSQGLFHPGDVLLQDFQKRAASLPNGINPSLAAELIGDAQRIREAIGGN